MSFLIREPADVYHAQAGQVPVQPPAGRIPPQPAALPQEAAGAGEGRGPAGVPHRPRGARAHPRGPRGLRGEFAFGGPVNPKTGEPFGSRTKAFQEWADAQGKPVLTDDQVVLIENLNAAVHAHEHAAALLADGVPEGVIRADYCGMACQARLDWLSPQRGIVDLKTCDNLDWLQMDARSYGYVHQLAFYRSLAACVTGTDPSRLPHRRGEARAVPLRRVADGRGRPRDRAEGERGGASSA